MGHTCDHCDREATVHEVLVRDGKRVERHLCEEHAKQFGVFHQQSHAGVGQVVQAFMLAKSGLAAAAKASETQCPSCGLTFAKFRQDGLLGCPACYEAFAEKLTPLLMRAHDGGEHHTGKTPRRAVGSAQRMVALGRLRQALREAVEAEAYERAAQLRDEIDALSSGEAGGGVDGGVPDGETNGA